MSQTVGLFCGNQYIEAELPEQARILKAPPDPDYLANLDDAIRQALNNPVNHKPARELVQKGSRVLIAFDDLAVPIPPMMPPDNREAVIGVLLQELYAAGVEKKDITLLCANGMHRMWKRSELKIILGERILAEFGPAQLLCHDAEDRENLVHLGLTQNGYDVEVNRRLLECDQAFYVNVNWAPFNGGWKSTVIGLGTYRTIRHIHNHDLYLAETGSCMEPRSNLLHARIDEMGEQLNGCLASRGKKVFQIETTVNGELSSRMSGIVCGHVPDVHSITLARLLEKKVLDVEGQSDVLLFGLPDVMPYSVGTIINPILIARMGLGYLFSNYMNKPLVKPKGTLILCNPLIDQVDPVHHPSYVNLWEEGFSRTGDAGELYELYADEYANRPEFVHKYRFGYGFHGAHPVQAYTTTLYPKRYLGQIIAAGCQDQGVAKKLGWRPLAGVQEALQECAAKHGEGFSLTLVQLPPFFTPRVL